MNHLIICNTPYQVFNAINILVNNVNMDHSDCDVFIDETFHSFKDSKKIGTNMLHHKLCRNIYYGRQKHIAVNQKHSKVNTFLYLLERNHIDEYTFSNNKILNIPYSTIWVGDSSIIGCSLAQINANSEVVWYDDGMSSYSMSPRSFGRSRLHIGIMKLFRLGFYKYKPGKLYVNNSSLAMSKEFSVQQLPIIDEKNIARDMIGHVFNYENKSSFLPHYRFFALIDGQIIEGAAGYNGTAMEEVIEMAGFTKSNIIIRRHPRDKREYHNYDVDNGANLWELECINNITDSHVLLACCSTAQLTPKLICQREPYLIFLYKIFINKGSRILEENANLIEKIKKMYSDRSKIFVPNNIEELKLYVSKLQSN